MPHICQTHQLQKYSHSTTIQKNSHSTRNIYLRFLRLFGTLLPIQVVGFAETHSIMPIFTTISTQHIVPLATHFNALVWSLINSYFPLFFGPPALFPWLRWFYRVHTLINRPLIRARHRINPEGLRLFVCIHHVPMADISFGFFFIEVYRTNCMWTRNTIKLPPPTATRSSLKIHHLPSLMGTIDLKLHLIALAANIVLRL
jgi:hypothetical protein